jgi:hypothetical protein
MSADSTVFEKGVSSMRQEITLLSRSPGEGGRRPGRGLMFSLAVLTASVVAAICASAASANSADHFSFGPGSGSETISGFCPFDLTLNFTFSGSGTAFFDQSGNLIMEQDNLTEQDTFSANGKSLTGMPYTTNTTFTFDSSGNLTGATGNGVLEKVPLPDGSLFIGAGTVNLLSVTSNFVFAPDHGAFQNMAGFCAALSP